MRSITQLRALGTLCVCCVRLHFGGYLTPGSWEEPVWGGTWLNGRGANAIHVCVCEQFVPFIIITQLKVWSTTKQGTLVTASWQCVFH